MTGPVIDMGYMSLPPAVQGEIEDHIATENQKHKNCVVCGTKIQMMCRYYDDVCCIICEKVKTGEMDRILARAYKPEIPLEDGQWRPSIPSGSSSTTPASATSSSSKSKRKASTA